VSTIDLLTPTDIVVFDGYFWISGPVLLDEFVEWYRENKSMSS
jgi:hypothetical protein